MHYFFFRCHSAQLEELDDQEFDDDEETEWQHYLRSSIECIMRVADVFPDDVLQLMVISRKFFVKLISRKKVKCIFKKYFIIGYHVERYNGCIHASWKLY